MCSPAGGPSRLKILVTLKADAEYRLKGNTDMRLRFMELMTTEYTEVMMQLYDGDEVNKETLVADVTDRDVGKEPDGVFYELAAESCIPGIETKDCTNIFAEDERLFCFGSHMVGREVTERYKLSNPIKVPCKR